MKKIALLTILFCAFISLTAKEKQLTISKQKVQLIITEKTSETQLKKFKKILKEEANIDFAYKDIIVNSKNQISKITIEVDSNDGLKASGILMISTIFEVGFIRDYSATFDSSSEKPLIIGNVGEKEIELK